MPEPEDTPGSADAGPGLVEELLGSVVEAAVWVGERLATVFTYWGS